MTRGEDAGTGADARLPGLELVPEGVLVLDADQRVVHANERAHVLLGLAPDVLGKPLGDAVALVDGTGAIAGDELLPDSTVVDRLAERVLRVRLPDGRLRPVAVAGRFLAGGGVALTFRNAGRRERIEVARSDLVATVSHEIRSPLTSVKGFTRTMLVKWDRFSDEQKRTMLETINLDADRVTRLLKELLDVSRIDAGRVELHRRMVDVAALAHHVADKARHRPAGEDRSIAVDVADDLPGVYADPDKLEQVLTNLVDNALEYAPQSPIRIVATTDEDHVHVIVEDHGPGIPDDQLRHIFEKFGRGRNARRAGTGLGLYISRGLVEAHGGSMWAESELGTGCRFHLKLPGGVPPELRSPGT